jgi:hypothetical protein
VEKRGNHELFRFLGMPNPVPAAERPGPHWKMPLLTEREERGARERPTLSVHVPFSQGEGSSYSVLVRVFQLARMLDTHADR